MWQYTVIALVSIISSSKVLNFYFWHDDYSLVYQPPSGKCLFSWPYESYCYIFPLLKSLFGLHAQLYFILGFFLFILSVLVFYKFLKILLKKNVLLPALLYASVLGGQGAFYEGYSLITTFLSLNLFFAYLIYLQKYFQNKSQNRYQLINSLLFFFLSIIALKARSATYFLPGLLLIWLMGKKTKFRKKVFLSGLIIIIFFTSLFNVSKLFVSGSGGSSLSVIPTYLGYSYLIEASEFFTSFNSLVILQWLPVLPKLSFIILIIFYLILIKKILTSAFQDKTFIFALGLIIFLYLPYGLRTDGPLDPNGRYAIFLIPGICLLLGSMLKNKIIYCFTIILVLFSLIKSEKLFSEHYKYIQNQKIFYQQLVKLEPEIADNAYLYIQTKDDYLSTFDDTFRIGYLPPEATLATYYDTDYHNLHLITHTDELMEIWPKVNPQNYYYFYFDPDTKQLTNYTFQARSWMSKDLSLYSLENYQSFIPVSLDVLISATIKSPDIPFPLNCSQSPQDLVFEDWKNYLDIIATSREIKRVSLIKATHSGDDVYPNSILDNDQRSVWYPDRQDWFKNIFPELEITLKNTPTLSQLLLFSSNTNSIPNDFTLSINDTQINPQTTSGTNWLLVKFEPIKVNSISLLLKSSLGGDIPTITDIEFINSGKELDPDAFGQLINCPIETVTTKDEHAVLEHYFSRGMQACLAEYKFNLIPDGKQREYNLVTLPRRGEKLNLSFSCLPYPVKINIDQVKFAPFVQ